jgi:hypothetical protein
MNRPGRSIHFIDGSLAPEVPGPVAGLNLSSTETSLSGRARRNAKLAIVPVLITHQPAVRDRPLIQSFLRPVFGSVGTLSLQRAASRGATRISLAIRRTYFLRCRGPSHRRNRPSDAPGAHKRSPRIRVTILSRPCRSAAATSMSRVSLGRICCSRWLGTDLTLLAGDSLDEFGDRSHDRIRTRCWFKPTSPTS